MGQGKGNLGGKFSPWGHRLDLEAKAAPLAAPLDLFKGEGRAGACSSQNPSRRPPSSTPPSSAAAWWSLQKFRHHRHHTIVLPIPSTTPPYLAGPRRQIHYCAVRVHCSEAPPVVALGSDQIARRRRLVRLHHPRSIERFRCVISSRVWRSHLSLSLITSPRLDLGLLVRIHRKFLIYYAAKPLTKETDIMP
jgi:hypothetical protein